MKTDCGDKIDDVLLTPGYVENPYPTYDLLRSEFPVYWCRKWNGWLITRYDDAQAILKDHQGFSNRGRYTQFLAPLSVEQRSRLSYLQNHYERGGLVQSDPPAHSRLRQLIGSAFIPRIVNEMEGLVQEIVAELIGEFAGDAEVELIRQLAFPLPAIVIAGMLGVPREERNQFKHWSSAIQRFLGSGTVNFELALAAQEAWRSMNDYFEALFAERLHRPQNDLVSSLAAARVEGQQLTREEVIRTCGAILIAGHETTTNLISNGLWLLLRHPDQLMQLRADASLYGPAIEEFLRIESPFQSLPRTVMADIELHGHLLRRGQLVQVMIGAANRDPLRFPDPNTLDIHRSDNKHLAFGYGVHFCLGAALARLEAPIALRALLDRFPRMQLIPSEPPRWKVSMVQRGMESFRLRLG